MKEYEKYLLIADAESPLKREESKIHKTLSKKYTVLKDFVSNVRPRGINEVTRLAAAILKEEGVVDYISKTEEVTFTDKKTSTKKKTKMKKYSVSSTEVRKIFDEMGDSTLLPKKRSKK